MPAFGPSNIKFLFPVIDQYVVIQNINHSCYPFDISAITLLTLGPCSSAGMVFIKYMRCFITVFTLLIFFFLFSTIFLVGLLDMFEIRIIFNSDVKLLS